MHTDARKRLERLGLIYLLLLREEQGFTAKELSQLCCTHRRTTFRDLHSLQEQFGFPVVSEGGKWKLASTARLKPLALTPAEAVVLALATRLFSRQTDHYDQAIASAFGKLQHLLPDRLSDYLGQVIHGLTRIPADPDFRRRLERIVECWIERRTVRIHYEDDAQARDVDPYFIEPAAFGLGVYVMGKDHRSGRVRTFKIERIQSAVPTANRFEVPEDFDIHQLLGHSWRLWEADPVRVVLRFTPAVAGRVRESRWHPSQMVEDEADGGVCLTLTVAGTVEIRPWVLGWGRNVEVLEPHELREWVAETAAAMARLYAPSPALTAANGAR